MKLIFAYIENFKNIKKQSFNFDSKYKCKYDYENRILEIEKNEYNVKIFSENIVFNAIVGPNGSGKTSLIEFLILMFFNSENYEENLEGFVLLEENGEIYINYYGNEKNIISLKKDEGFNELSEEEKEIVDFVIESTQDLNWGDFINLVYSTYPIIKAEKFSILNLVELAKEYKKAQK